ncbi:MAG: hypothetical protein DRH44_07565, partial [Candidatus Coatesbacteria bacterium]
MSVWVNFVGRKYYTEDSFEKEVRELGFSRRVPLKMLSSFEFGDIILFLMKQGRNWAKFICAGILTGIGGLEPEVVKELAEEFGGRLTEEEETKLMIRGCGTYEVEVECEFDLTSAEITMKKIAERIKDKGDEAGLPMLSGIWTDVGDVLGTDDWEKIRVDIPFSRGFRLFDLDRFKVELAKTEPDKKGIYHVKGMFYGNHKGQVEVEVESGVLIGVKHYVRFKGRSYRTRVRHAMELLL